MDTANLVRLTTIAHRLNVTRQAVNNWENRHPDFPPPAQTIDDVRFWDWPAISRWHAAREDAK